MNGQDNRPVVCAICHQEMEEFRGQTYAEVIAELESIWGLAIRIKEEMIACEVCVRPR